MLSNWMGQNPMFFSCACVQLAAFAIDGMISAMVVCGSTFVANAVPGVSPTGNGSMYGPLFMTDSYADEMLILLSG